MQNPAKITGIVNMHMHSQSVASIGSNQRSPTSADLIAIPPWHKKLFFELCSFVSNSRFIFYCNLKQHYVVFRP